MEPKAHVVGDDVVTSFDFPGSWEHDGVMHPAALMDTGTDAELRERGIYRLTPARVPDGMLFSHGALRHDIDHDAGTVRARYETTPVPLADAQAVVHGRIRAHSAALLERSDWKVVRAFEHSQLTDEAKAANPALAHQAFDVDLYIARNAVRAAASQHIAAVETLETTAAVAAYDWRSGWPTAP